MTDFIVNSLIASVVLTVLINVLARLFPGTSAEDRIRDLVGEPRPDPLAERHEEPPKPTFRIWFPWKQMIIWSMVITIAINVLQLLD